MDGGWKAQVVWAASLHFVDVKFESHSKFSYWIILKKNNELNLRSE